MLTEGKWPIAEGSFDSGPVGPLRRKRPIAIAMLVSWTTLTVMQNIAAARIGAVIAGTFRRWA